MRPHAISLALQGGGAHGAFTWGVLERLLDEDRLEIDCVSGSSAGAMNAVMLAQGMMEDGPEGARRLLSRFWDRVARQVPAHPLDLALGNNGAPALVRAYRDVAALLSPALANPLELNPLADLITDLVDFEALRRESPLELFIAATHVASGRLRLFQSQQLRPEVLLASACLPLLHHTVYVDGEPYWDGGYSANPAVFPLVYQCRPRDVVVVLINPLERPNLPRGSEEIRARIGELGLSAHFLREMRAIADIQERLRGTLPSWSPLDRRFRRLNLHLIHASEHMRTLPAASKLDVRRAFLEDLRDRGRAAAQAWLAAHHQDLGRRSSVDLGSLFDPRAQPLTRSIA